MEPGAEVSVCRLAVCGSPGQDDELGALRGSVRELRVELEGFRRGVDRQMEDVLRLAGPLSRSVTDLQSENRQLREQVEKLSRQVELLSRAAGLSAEGQARYSTHTMLAVSSKSQSVVPEEQYDVEATRTSVHSVVENGHQSLSEKMKISQNASSAAPALLKQEHSPALSVRMPHMPVTAVTKVITESHPGSTSSSSSSSNQSVQEVKSTLEMTPRSSNSQGAVRTWNASVARTMGVSASTEKSITVSKSSQSYTVSGSAVISESSDRYFDVTPKSQSPPPAVTRQAERKRELVRSQTLPRSSGTQARKAFFEKFDSDSAKGKGESKVKLKRSQSFGVASASSIKQILLEWCRSKTIGYKNIDLQNFSSSWNDGMAFCALVHSFFPEVFDYDALEPTNHKQNFETAFSTAEKFANCDRLIEVEDMLMMGKKPDPMCVFTYVQSLYNHLRRFE